MELRNEGSYCAELLVSRAAFSLAAANVTLYYNLFMYISAFALVPCVTECSLPAGFVHI